MRALGPATLLRRRVKLLDMRVYGAGSGEARVSARWRFSVSPRRHRCPKTVRPLAFALPTAAWRRLTRNAISPATNGNTMQANKIVPPTTRRCSMPSTPSQYDVQASAGQWTSQAQQCRYAGQQRMFVSTQVRPNCVTQIAKQTAMNIQIGTNARAIDWNVTGSPESDRILENSIASLAEIAQPHQLPNANHIACPRMP